MYTHALCGTLTCAHMHVFMLIHVHAHTYKHVCSHVLCGHVHRCMYKVQYTLMSMCTPRCAHTLMACTHEHSQAHTCMYTYAQTYTCVTPCSPSAIPTLCSHPVPTLSPMPLPLQFPMLCSHAVSAILPCCPHTAPCDVPTLSPDDVP